MGRSVNNMSVALFGGTFNPVHFGHVKIAAELAELLQVQSMRMLPCAFPPHRDQPAVAAKQRLAMLQLAIGEQSALKADDLELHRAAPSYSIDTVQLVRQEIGEQTPLFLCVGMDSLVTLDSWQRWHELLDHCHIVIPSRPGWQAPSQGVLADWIAQHRCDDLAAVKKCSRGHVHFCDLTLLDLSSTNIRDKIKQGESINFMTPDTVVDYIQKHHLYE